jgi:hypothetical protein
MEWNLKWSIAGSAGRRSHPEEGGSVTRGEYIAKAIRDSEKLTESEKESAIEHLRQIARDEIAGRKAVVTHLMVQVLKGERPDTALAGAFVWSSEAPGRAFWVKIVQAI